MITSKQIINLTEKYLKGKQYYGNFVDILENPSNREVVDLFGKKVPEFLKDIRFIADAETKKVYVWNSELATHNMVQNDVGYPNVNDKPNIILGTGKVSGGKPTITEWDFSRYFASKKNLDFLGKIFSYKWDWLSVYVNNMKEFLSTEEEKYLKLVK
jgi:hypothetical protein